MGGGEHSQSVNLGTRYVYTCVGAECGGGGGGRLDLYMSHRFVDGKKYNRYA